eukprot:5311142-Karenia_brevis.AAC.1
MAVSSQLQARRSQKRERRRQRKRDASQKEWTLSGLEPRCHSAALGGGEVRAVKDRVEGFDAVFREPESEKESATASQASPESFDAIARVANSHVEDYGCADKQTP